MASRWTLGHFGVRECYHRMRSPNSKTIPNTPRIRKNPRIPTSLRGEIGSGGGDAHPSEEESTRRYAF